MKNAVFQLLFVIIRKLPALFFLGLNLVFRFCIFLSIQYLSSFFFQAKGNNSDKFALRFALEVLHLFFLGLEESQCRLGYHAGFKQKPEGKSHFIEGSVV